MEVGLQKKGYELHLTTEVSPFPYSMLYKLKGKLPRLRPFLS
jgi:hypothetical protein